jgi:hypothetical protein
LTHCGHDLLLFRPSLYPLRRRLGISLTATAGGIAKPGLGAGADHNGHNRPEIRGMWRLGAQGRDHLGSRAHVKNGRMLSRTGEMPEFKRPKMTFAHPSFSRGSKATIATAPMFTRFGRSTSCSRSS